MDAETAQDRTVADWLVDGKFRGEYPAEDRGEAAWSALMDARLALRTAADLLLVMAHYGESLGGVQPRRLLGELSRRVVSLAGLVERAGVKGDGR